MRRVGTSQCGCGLLLITLLVAPSACERSSTGPVGPCYTVELLHPTGTAVSDTVAVRSAFMAYVSHLEQINGYPVEGWSALEYRRAVGTEYYQGMLYWGVAAWGVHVEGDSLETTMFRVRQDGTVVAMLGCI